MPDFEAIFGLTLPPLELVLRGSLVYFGLVLLFRFVLRRDLGELRVTDVLFIALVADAAQNGMSGEYRSVGDAVVLLATLGAWNVALDYAIYRWDSARRFFEPPAVELIRDGRLLRRNLRREWFTVEELVSQLREKGISDVTQVKLATLESDGELSVLEKGGARASQRKRESTRGTKR